MTLYGLPFEATLDLPVTVFFALLGAGAAERSHTAWARRARAVVL